MQRLCNSTAAISVHPKQRRNVAGCPAFRGPKNVPDPRASRPMLSRSVANSVAGFAGRSYRGITARVHGGAGRSWVPLVPRRRLFGDRERSAVSPLLGSLGRVPERTNRAASVRMGIIGGTPMRRRQHSDIKHLNTLLWKTPADLADGLNRRISGVIGVGPAARDPT